MSRLHYPRLKIELNSLFVRLLLAFYGFANSIILGVTTTDIEPTILDDPEALWLAYAYCYDQRGGAVETSFKQDNQALKIKKRNKKRFEAQQMLTQLEVLAHNRHYRK